MAKILSRKKQNDVYQRLFRIICELSKQDDTDDVRYAISDAFDIAMIVGDLEMLEALGEKPTITYKQSKFHTKLSNLVELIDDFSERPKCYKMKG